MRADDRHGGCDCPGVTAKARSEAQEARGPDAGDAWVQALERCAAMSVPERAAMVLDRATSCASRSPRRSTRSCSPGC
jgi:hypothetical protein